VIKISIGCFNASRTEAGIRGVKKNGLILDTDLLWGKTTTHVNSLFKKNNRRLTKDNGSG